MFNEICDKLEKSYALADFAFEKAETLYDMVEKNRELMYQEASVFVYANDREYSDLETLYEAADSETAEKKEGILASIINAVGSIFNAIGNAITGLFGRVKGKKVPERTKLDKFTAEAMGYLPELEKESSNLLSKLSNPAAAITALGAVGTTIFASLKFLKHRKESKKQGQIEGGEQPAQITNNTLVPVDGAKVIDSLKLAEKIKQNFTKIIEKIKEIFKGALDKMPKPGKKKEGGEEAAPEQSTALTVIPEKDEGIIKKAMGVFRQIGGALKDFVAKLIKSLTTESFTVEIIGDDGKVKGRSKGHPVTGDADATATA